MFNSEIMTKNSSLQMLQFKSNGPITPAGYAALADALPLSNVTQLSIEGNPLRYVCCCGCVFLLTRTRNYDYFLLRLSIS